jgi:hypothetical protein
LKAVSNSTFGFTPFDDCPAREIGRGFFCKRLSKDQARRKCIFHTGFFSFAGNRIAPDDPLCFPEFNG